MLGDGGDPLVMVATSLVMGSTSLSMVLTSLVMVSTSLMMVATYLVMVGPQKHCWGVLKDDCCTEMFRGNGNSKVSPTDAPTNGLTWAGACVSKNTPTEWKLLSVTFSLTDIFCKCASKKGMYPNILSCFVT